MNRGLWNATTNTPGLINGTGVEGDFYLVDVAGTQDLGAGPITFNYNDLVLYNGSHQWVQYAITVPGGGITSITAGAGLLGGTITTSGTISMPNVGTAGTYGDSTHIPQITTDNQGRVSGVTLISIASGTVTSITATAPLTGGTITTSGSIGITKSDTSTDGYLSSTDWNTFNGKQAALTIGNLTEATSSVLTITGGTGAIIGSGLTIQVKQASGSVSGYLSSTDWTTFNNKGSGTVTSVSGTTNRITSTGGTTPVIDIDAAYVGQTSITTLGTIGTGTWAGTTVAVNHGGTGLATLTAHNLIIGNGTGTPNFLAPSSAGLVPYSNGTDFVMSTPTMPLSASATSRKIIVSDGTNWVASTETYATPSTSGKVMVSDGTNWTSATATGITATGTMTSGTLSTGYVVAGVTMTLGSDANYDIYYRNSSGVLTRLANGTTGQLLTATTSSAPSWASPAAPTSYTGLIETINFEDSSSSIAAQTYTLDLYPTYGYTINSLVIGCDSGTATAAIKINGTNVTSLSSVSVSSSTLATEVSATGANTVSAGASNKVTLVISSPSSMNNLQARLKITRT